MKESNVIQMEMSTDIALSIIAGFMQTFLDALDENDIAQHLYWKVTMEALSPLIDKSIEMSPGNTGKPSYFFDLVIATSEAIKKIADDERYLNKEEAEEIKSSMDGLIFASQSSLELAKEIRNEIQKPL